MSDFKVICMTEEFWMNSHFSAARYYGRVKVGNHEYVIVNKEGKDIFECSAEAKKAGRENAIEPGQPADLCRRDFVPFYRRLGRDLFLQILRENNNAPEEELKKIFAKKQVELC